MSMALLTILQIVEVFLIYTAVTIFLPGMVFGASFQNKRLTVRLLAYYCIGNFVIMMLVQVLSLLHLCYGLTVFAGTIITYLVAWSRVYRRSLKELGRSLLLMLKYTLSGTMGKRNLAAKCGDFYKLVIRPKLIAARDAFTENVLEWGMIAVIFVCIWYVYGKEILTQFGYAFSDQPVHNYWINYIGQQKLFVAGVYPMGFHCVIYYLYKVTGVDVYILLRIFGVIQDVFIYLMLAAVIKVLGNSRFVGYLIAILAVLFGGLSYICTFRYVQALPQEYGQVFILPAVVFLAEFIREKTEELKKLKKRKKKRRRKKVIPIESKATGWMIAFSVCCGFSAHFYDTFILAIFVVGIVVGYFIYVIRPAYFIPLLKYGMLGILLAIIPMVASVATGNKLQGSIGWGLSVINGTNNSSQAASEDTVYYNEDGLTTSEDGYSVIVGKNFTIINDMDVYNEMLEAAGKERRETEERETQRQEMLESGSIRERAEVYQASVQEKLKKYKAEIDERMRSVLFQEDFAFLVPYVYLAILITLLMGIGFMLLRQVHYGCGFVAMAVSLGGLLILMSASAIGIPALMDVNRSRIYFAYCLPILLGIIIDGLCTLAGMIVRWKRAVALLGVFLCELVTIFVFENSFERLPVVADQIQLGSSVICLTNIIKNEEDFTWTIVSASDERNMGFDHGYHVELITFLHDMEGFDGTQRIQIPTKYVFFFVEKIPANYGGYTALSGMPVTEEDAYKRLGSRTGSSAYKADRRWTTMARFYYWAQEFQSLYPREMEVYYETEDFVCYRLTQNTYSLFNMAIDYYYNMFDYDVVEWEQQRQRQQEAEERLRQAG